MMDVKVSEGGRVVIPAELRAALGIAIGDTLAWKQDGDRLVLTSRSASIKRAQALFAQHCQPGKAKLVDELLRERRAEQAAEDRPRHRRR